MPVDVISALAEEAPLVVLLVEETAELMVVLPSGCAGPNHRHPEPELKQESYQSGGC